jgi:LuxR family maltose regulon positive regulatory protein
VAVKTQDAVGWPAEPLIATKLAAPPPRPGLVSRAQLAARLDACLDPQVALTVLSAPAGFGKTTLLADWLASLVKRQEEDGKGQSTPADDNLLPFAFSLFPSPPKAAWLTLDADDSDPARFWAYVVAALCRALPELSAALASHLRGPEPQFDRLVVALANSLDALGTHVVIVLDDYHLLSGAEVHRGLAALVERRPPCLHLLLAGRADPPLPTARLRARGLLRELRAADLRFSPAEAHAFLTGTMGLDLDADAAAELERYTEGWPAGLQLAALWLREHPGAHASRIADLVRHDRYLLEFLLDEVIRRQPPELQRFLLDTAILDRMCPELCDYVRADAGPFGTPAAELLERMEQQNLFVVPLDARREWYRYHNLFGDALRRQLAHERPAAAVNRLHRRAAAWFAAASTEDAELMGEAVSHAAAGRAFDLAADLIAPRADLLWAHGLIGRLNAWLGALPEELLLSRPGLALRYAWGLFLHARQEDAARWLAAGEAGLAEREGRGDPAGAALPDAIKAAMAATRRDPDAVVAHAARAAALLPPDEPFWRPTVEISRGLAHLARGEQREAAACLSLAAELYDRTDSSYGRMIALWHLGRVRLAQGRLDEASRAFRRISADGADAAYAGYSDVGLAEVAYERDDLAAARSLGERGVARLEAGGQPRVLVFAAIVLARACFAEGDADSARVWLDRGDAIALQLELEEEHAELALARAALGLRAGDLAAVDEWAAAGGLAVASPDPTRLREQLVVARALAARGRADAALRLVGPLLAYAEAHGQARDAQECELSRALALERSGQSGAARAALARAVQIAGGDGLVRPILDAGPELGELLGELHADPRAADPAAPLARGLAALERRGRPVPHAPQAAPRAELADYEALSEREQRVLGLIAADCSNAEIASALVVSVNTIKTHIKRIYEKLGVSSRVGAVERARELGLYR